MHVESQPIATITPSATNPRTIPAAAIDQVAKSIATFGFRQPIVIDADGVIIAGHTRYLAAQQLGLTDIPVHVATDLTPEQIQAYRIADNKTGEASNWDEEVLASLLGDLADDMRDATGFTDAELERLLGTLADDLAAAEQASHADEPVPAVFEIIVAVDDEASQQQLYERLKAEGLRCRVLSA